MKPQHTKLNKGITRRSALKTGVAVSSGLAFGGTAVGTVRANGVRKAETKSVIPVDLFVRKEGESDETPADPNDPPAPAPMDDDLLEERRAGNPVDDGTNAGAVDGELGQLTWKQFSDIEGRIKLKCLKKGTHVSMHLDGLVPKALYTAWVVVFDEPGFTPGIRDLFPEGAPGTAFENLVGFAPLGKNDGTQNVFRASASGAGQVTAIDRPRTYTGLGPKGDPNRKTETCLLDEYEVHFIGAFHLDGMTWGPVPDNPSSPGTIAEQLSFMWVDDEFVTGP